jgi:hypothetical protein
LRLLEHDRVKVKVKVKVKVETDDVLRAHLPGDCGGKIAIITAQVDNLQ